MAKRANLICFSAPVEIQAAEGEGKGPPKFSVVAYTGIPLQLAGFDMPVVVDLATLGESKSLVANLDHETNKRVGNVSDRINDGKTLQLSGAASAATPSRDEVVNSAAAGFQWQASIEATAGKLEKIPANKSVDVNGQTFPGPLYVARGATLKGFAFVSHGADDNTTVSIAAHAASTRTGEKTMFEQWLEAKGFDPAELTDTQKASLQAAYAAETGAKPKTRAKVEDVIAKARDDEERQEKIADVCAQAIAKNAHRDGDFVNKLEALAGQAVKAGWAPEKFELEVLRASEPNLGLFTPRNAGPRQLSNKLLQAAICQAGRLKDYEKQFDDQTLQAAHDRFKGRIGLKQLFVLCAEANGHRSDYSSDMSSDVLKAAFIGSGQQSQIRAASGFSTLDIANVLAATANKFLRDGWNAVDMTPLRIAAIRSVNDFKTITTVSLTGDLQFEKVGTTGEIKHGTLADLTYSNKVETYAKMLAITRQDFRNDDLGALTAVPRRLGRGAGLKLNDVFWTEFLSPSVASFFSSGNSNVNTGVADMTVGGLAATETIFLNQTDPDGKPLGAQAAILLVPTALKPSALTLMESERLIDGSSTAAQGSANIWRGRFRVESSPYMSNSAYTGYSAVAWYMLADPNELPLIEIAALDGRVEPTIETAEADFSVLGVQMRGYSDIGVKVQEKRAGVQADGGSS